jgi:hypothetical protein
MITIAHGNDSVASRNFYIEEKQKTESNEVFDGEKLDFDTFFQIFEGNSLFENEKYVFIENFFSKTKSNSLEFKKIIDYINKAKDINLFFWEQKELTKAQCSSLKNSTLRLFNYPQLLFNFLDNLKPNNLNLISLYNQLQKTMEAELIFYMIVRQFRIMLALIDSSDDKIDEAKRIAPWQSSKIKSQAKYFEQEKLLEIYKKLYTIDYNTKFGLNSLSLTKTIDIFLLDL